jgi:hypothetical protein
MEKNIILLILINFIIFVLVSIISNIVAFILLFLNRNKPFSHLNIPNYYSIEFLFILCEDLDLILVKDCYLLYIDNDKLQNLSIIGILYNVIIVIVSKHIELVACGNI